MRIRKTINIFVGFFCLLHVAPLIAMTVYDPIVDVTLITNFAKEIDNQINTIKNQIQQINHAREQITQLTTQIQQLYTQIDLIKQTLAQIADDGFDWAHAGEKIKQLETLFDQTHGLAYNAINVGQQFSDLFPEYDKLKELKDGYAAHYKKIVDVTETTLKNILQIVGSSAQSFVNDAQRIAQLQGEAKGVQGHVQALQAGMRIAAEQASQLMMLRQTLIAQTNAQIAYYAAEMQKAATLEHSLETAIKQGAITAPPVGHSGKEIILPGG